MTKSELIKALERYDDDQQVVTQSGHESYRRHNTWMLRPKFRPVEFTYQYNVRTTGPLAFEGVPDDESGDTVVLVVA